MVATSSGCGERHPGRCLRRAFTTGPTGGSPAKPVGTVCIALASRDPQSPRDFATSQIQVRTFKFPGDRDFIRDRSAKMALAMLRFHLLNKPMPF